jgi:hypothetical protein
MRDLDRVITAHVLNTEDARKAYAEEYEFTHDDPRVEQELERLLDDALSYDPPRTKAEVPLHLLLALVLRRRGRGRPRKISFSQGRKRALLLAALRKKKRQRQPGESATQALWRVAEEGAESFQKLFGEKRSIDTVKRWLEDKPRPRR